MKVCVKHTSAWHTLVLLNFTSSRHLSPIVREKLHRDSYSWDTKAEKTKDLLKLAGSGNGIWQRSPQKIPQTGKVSSSKASTRAATDSCCGQSGPEEEFEERQPSASRNPRPASLCALEQKVGLFTQTSTDSQHVQFTAAMPTLLSPVCCRWENQVNGSGSWPVKIQEFEDFPCFCQFSARMAKTCQPSGECCVKCKRRLQACRLTVDFCKGSLGFLWQ